MLQKTKLAEIYERQADTIYLVAVGYGMQRADCEDIVHETFLKLMRYAPDFESQEHEKAWLIVTAANICKNLFRKRYRKDLPLEDWDRPEEAKSAEAENDLLAALRKLPERLRLTVHLYYYEGYQSAEIAEMLGLHPASVRRQLSQARKLLKEELGGEWE